MPWILILKYLKQYWPIIAILVGVLGVGVYIQVLRTKLDNRNDEILELTADIHQLTSEKKACEASIDEQNVAIDRFVLDVERQKIEMEKLGKVIDKMRVNGNTRVVKIFKERKPENCEKSIQYLIEAIKELQWDK